MTMTFDTYQTPELYHTNSYQGTMTAIDAGDTATALYHTKSY